MCKGLPMTVMNKRKGLPRLGLFWYQHSMRVQAPYNRATCYNRAACYNRATGFDSFISNSSHEVNAEFKIEVAVQRVPEVSSSALLAISPTNWPVFDKTTVAVKQQGRGSEGS